MQHAPLPFDAYFPVDRLQSVLHRFARSINLGCRLVSARGEVFLSAQWLCDQENLPISFADGGVSGCLATDHVRKNWKVAEGNATRQTCAGGFSFLVAPILIEAVQLGSLYIGPFARSCTDARQGPDNVVSREQESRSGVECTTRPPILSEEQMAGLYDRLEIMVELLAEMGRLSLQKRETLQALHQSEERYQNLIESFPLVVYESDPEGRIVFANDRALEHFNCTSADIHQGLNLLSFVPPEVRPKFSERQQLLLKGVDLEPTEYTLTRKNGLFDAALVYSRPIVIDGKVSGIRSISIDITERKAMEERLLASEQRYRALFEGANDAIILLSAGRIIECNDEALHLLQRPREDIIGREIETFSPPRQRAVQATTTRKNHWIPAADQGNRSRFDWDILLPDHTIRETEVSLSRFDLGAQVHVLALLHDMTERNRNRRALEERESAWRAIFEHAPYGIVVNRLSDGMYLDANPAYEECGGGRRREDIIGKTPKDFLPPAQIEKSRQAKELLLATGRLHNQEATSVAPDGSERHVLYSASIFHANGDPCVLSMFVDITERKKMEARLQHNEKVLNSLFQAVPVGLVILKDRRFLVVNEQVTTITGYTAEELHQQSARLLYESEEEFQHVGRALYDTLWHKGSGYVETRFRRKDGARRYLSLFAAPLDRTDPEAGVAVAIEDISERVAMVRCLQESEQRFLKIAELSGQLLYDYDMDSGKVLWSGRIEAITGYSAEAFNNHGFDGWIERIHPEDREYVLAQLNAAAINQTVLSTDYRLRRDDATYIHVHEEGTYLYDEQGKPFRMLGTIKDVSAQKEGEIALKESESRYRTLFESGSDAIFLLKEDMVVDCNNKTLEMFRCTREQIIGVTPQQFSPSVQPDGRTFAKHGMGYIRAGLQGQPQQFEWVHIRFDQTTFHTDIRLSVVELSGEKRLQCIVRDITERKKAEGALRESEFRFRSFFNTSPDGILLIDFQGMILDVNKAFLRESGYLRKECAGTHFKEFVPSGDQARIVEAIVKLKSGIAQEQPIRFSYCSKDGLLIPVEAKGWLVVDEKSNPLYLGAFIHNMSKELALAEEKAALEKQVIQAQRNEAIGTLAGGIAHDFNNILGGIIGYTELAIHRTPTTMDGKTGEYLKRVLEGGNRAKDLVQQILRFSRHSATVMEPINLLPVVKESIRLMRSTLPSTITIQQEFYQQADRILGDPTQIHQVMMNLATNALHAMRERGGILRIRLENTFLDTPRQFLSMSTEPGDYLHLQISDTGCGMQPAVVERIFEPYFTTKKIDEGTGLGMAVVMGIIKSHKGLIEVNSAVGKGTRFDIYLPLTGEEAAAKKNGFAPLPMGQGQRVLLVDDELFFLEVIKESLRLLGYEVTACSSSLYALEVFAAAPNDYELLITDQTMPEMTGVQLIQKIREFNKKIPIILCTGYSEVVSEQSAAYYGISQFLMKPVNTSDLAQAVVAVLAL